MPNASASSRAEGLGVWALLTLLATASWSCSIGATYWPSDEDLAAFEAAGPIEPEFDASRLLPGLPNAGPYRVATGDILAVTGSDVFLGVGVGGGAVRSGPSPAPGPEILEARVHPDGALTLPLVGAVEVVGLTLPEIEDLLVERLHPEFVVDQPSLVVRVSEHATRKVAVLGAVERPGVLSLPSDSMTLVSALTAAGGILKASNLKVGAKRIRLHRPGEEREENLLLPVRGLNIPFGDVALEGGETIEVERWDPDIFTVIGLVTTPGAYEYPPNREYNLMEALAIAGGTDRIADPPYATVYRKDVDGQILAVTFPLEGADLIESSLVRIRPGDVISVQHTLGSWSRTLLAEVLRLQVNLFVDPIRGN